MTATALVAQRGQVVPPGLGRVGLSRCCAELQTCCATSVLAAPWSLRLTCFSAVPVRVVRACDQPHGPLLAALAALAAAPVQPAPKASAGVAVCPGPASDTKKNKTCEGGRTNRPKQECFPGLRLECHTCTCRLVLNAGAVEIPLFQPEPSSRACAVQFRRPRESAVPAMVAVVFCIML